MGPTKPGGADGGEAPHGPLARRHGPIKNDA